MLRPIRLSALRAPPPSQLTRLSQRHQRRLVSFAPPSQKPRSYKGGLVRWALAGGALYWYATRDVDVFAEDARGRLASQKHPIILETQDEVEELPTVDTIRAARRERQAATMAQGPGPSSSEPAPPSAESSNEVLAQAATSATSPDISAGSGVATSADSPPSNATSAAASASPAGLEEEAQEQGAFNEETGEINWDCPCLGGMAHGPCGEQFREAFSCFVFSKEEPKGVDCIERFKTMQDCFRQHPDIYGEELTDGPDDGLDDVTDDYETTPTPAVKQQPSPEASPASAESFKDPKSSTSESVAVSNSPDKNNETAQESQSRSQKSQPQDRSEQPDSRSSSSESGENDTPIPKAYHDAREGK